MFRTIDETDPVGTSIRGFIHGALAFIAIQYLYGWYIVIFG